MAEGLAAKRLIFRELLRLVGQTLPASEGLVMASLGGDGMEPELREELSRDRGDLARVWFIERNFIRAEGLKRSFPDARLYHGPSTRLRDELVRTKDTSLHLVHWDLTGMRQANIQLMAATLPFLWRSDSRLLAVTLDDRFFCPPWADVGGIVRIAEGLFEECRVNWRILLDLYSEGGPGFVPSDGDDPRWVALRELAALLCVVFAPLASAAVALKGQDLAPLELLSRLGGRGPRPGWFMESAQRSMVFLPGELTRYHVSTDHGTTLRTYTFRYVRQSNDVWNSIRGWEWLFRAPLIRLTEQGPRVLRELQSHFVRPSPAAIAVADLLPVEPKSSSAPRLFDEETDEPPMMDALHNQPERTAPQAADHGATVPGLKEIACQQSKRTEKMEEIKKMTGTTPSKQAPAKAAAPGAVKKPAPAQRTEADHAYDRLRSLKDVISPLLWQNIETLYAEAKRERHPDHSKRIALLEGLVAELREEQGGKGTSPTARPSTPPRTAPPAPSKPAAKPKPAGTNGKGNGTDLEQKILGALKGKGKLRTEQLTKALGIEKSGMQLRRLLMRLRAEGKIKMEGQKRGTTYELVA